MCQLQGLLDHKVAVAVGNECREPRQFADLKDESGASLSATILQALLNHARRIFLYAQLEDLAAQLVKDGTTELWLPLFDDLAHSVVAKRVGD